MYVNPTLAQGLQVLTASTADKAASDKINAASADLIKTANGISNKTSNPLKQAAGTIGGAMLSLNEKNGPRTDEALREAARQKAVAEGSSWGAEHYDSIEDMPSYMREEAAKSWAYQNEQMAKLDTVAGMHHWNSQVSHHLREFMMVADEILNYWSYDANGSANIPPEKLAGMHPVESARIQTFEKNLKTAVAAISENANVTGDIFVKNGDGTWGWGVFEVRDKDTGALYFNHDGNGKVQFHDKGMVFSEFKTAGDSWGYEDSMDMTTYKKVFGRS
ncbi:hypothetical protein KHP60_23695 [Microvirga sp. 3-52]|uniref:hypothetical protein n=1 Tax=Microvirga sp. 3-52 TaxID=2792425 RepID=UPI001AC591F6|nr:hypothetical protein [Microvirga sp. 3-52]MBO1908653.1 hypothetical protein [Microvirga sp. 3-52]MBS7455304.1 hypothetical protein [Microvirga sp. 3-52]